MTFEILDLALPVWAGVLLAAAAARACWLERARNARRPVRVAAR